jgi:hypothetical protein
MLDFAAIDRDFQSFMDHIYILHPFLDPEALRSLIHTFKSTRRGDDRATRSASIVGPKRKRENDEPPDSVEGHDVWAHRGNQNGFTHGNSNSGTGQPPIEHSITNAIVLFVIALGRVTAHRDPLPRPAPPSPFNNQGGQGGLNGRPLRHVYFLFCLDS